MTTLTKSECYNNPLCSDFNINILVNDTDDKPLTILVSKYILCTQSEYFKNIVLKYSTDKHLNIILTEHHYLCDITVNHIMMFFRALYDIYDDNCENLCAIILIANFYGSLTVMNACADILEARIPNNCVTSIELVKFMEIDMMMMMETKIAKLHSSAMHVIMKEFNDIPWDTYDFMDASECSVLNKFRHAPFKVIINILKSTEIDNKINRCALFNFVIDWILHDHPTRKVCMKQILPMIKFGCMDASYIKFFIPECFRVYFPEDIVTLYNIITCTEFFWTFSSKNTWINNRVPRDFDVRNFHYNCKKSNHCIHLVMNPNDKHTLINTKSCQLSGPHCMNGFYCNLSLKITTIPSDYTFNGTYMYFDTNQGELLPRNVTCDKLYLNLFIQLSKPFNHNDIFTDGYFIDFEVDLSVCGSDYRTMSISGPDTMLHYCCTLYEFKSDYDITIDDLSCAFFECIENATDKIKFKFY